jgi:hypothetical protein
MKWKSMLYQIVPALRFSCVTQAPSQNGRETKTENLSAEGERGAPDEVHNEHRIGKYDARLIEGRCRPPDLAIHPV